MARFRNGLAVFVLAGGLVAVGGSPTLATAARPVVTVAATSVFRPVTGDVFVVFTAGKFARAQIHGKFSGGSGGEVLRLLAQQFPFTSAPVPAGSVTLAGATGSYSFTVTPSLATRYRVALFPNASSATPLAASTVRTVFVSNLMTVTGLKACSRPVCRQRVRVVEVVPASTRADEISKHWFFYFGLNLSPTMEPPPPKILTLNPHAAISASVPGGARRFSRTISFSFRIGRDGFSFNWTSCSKDTEATDGLGLPGPHNCGVKRVSATAEYLG